MAYIVSNLNRFYAALESAYGKAPAVTPGDAFRALRLDVELVQQYLERRDKSGSRSFLGVVAGGRRQGRFETEAYVMAGGAPGIAPDLAAFYQAACGGTPRTFTGGTAGAGCTTTTINFNAAHGLVAGQGIVSGGELRFVTTVSTTTSVVVSPAFTAAPTSGASIIGTVTYPLGASLPSLAIFDYWDPVSAQQRILNGAAVEQMELEIAGDFHTVTFTGEGQDVIDSITFASGQGGLSAFPAEPSTRTYNGEPIAGHLGQLWLGAPASRFNTLVRGKLALENGLELRKNEVGSAIPLGIAPGDRRVSFEFELFETDDGATRGLYTAARNRTPVEAFLQLGSTSGHIFGAFMKSLVPQPPKNDARENLLKWSFSGSRAGGSLDDELFIAFG